MKIIPAFLLCICWSKFSFCQDFYNAGSRFAKVTIADSLTTSTKDIAAFINAHYKTEQDKVSAIYSWVTASIKYDKDSALIINRSLGNESIISVALRRRRGVCENFATIFSDICLKAGVSSVVVNGYTKQDGRVDKSGHSWCAVQINNYWYLCDPTWDAGAGDFQHFLADPNNFIASHMPYDPLWQLLNYPVTPEEFYSGGTNRKKGSLYFNFADSIKAYQQMDSLQRFQSTAARIEKFGLYNSRIHDQYNYVKMNIEMINEDKELELYNSSIADLNEVTSILNKFINYRNNQFTPAKSDIDLKSSLDGIDAKVEAALQKLTEVDKSKATLTLGTEPVREKLTLLLHKINDQKSFLNKYLNTDKADRKKVFY